MLRDSLREKYIPIFDMIMCLSKALDFINPNIRNHHLRVSYIALRIADELKIPDNDKIDIFFAASLHDIGAFSYEDWHNILLFDAQDSGNHAEIGYNLLNMYSHFERVAPIVRYHHCRWSESGTDIPSASYIIGLADRIDSLIAYDKNVLGQVERITRVITNHSGKYFVPRLVDMFLRLARKEAFWLDLTSSSLDDIIAQQTQFLNVKLDLNNLLSLSQLFSQIIDFRSRFTATHSTGVAATAEALAVELGFSPKEVQLIKVAGNLHDLGKLAVPKEILEKPGELNQDELNIIRTHTYYTFQVLDGIKGLESVKYWASFHHERLDGNGYPFHCTADELSLFSRIMAIADVFTAITEDRPYRKGMNKELSVKILDDMATAGVLDFQVVNILKNHYDRINDHRIQAQTKALHQFEEFEKSLGPMVMR